MSLIVVIHTYKPHVHNYTVFFTVSVSVLHTAEIAYNMEQNISHGNFVGGAVPDNRNPIASKYKSLRPWKPTIWPPSIVRENGVPSSTPNGPNVLRLLFNVSDRITGVPMNPKGW